MLFKRQNPRSFYNKLRDYFWPRSGWTRALKYNKHRLIRLPDSSHKIAAGMAYGIAVSFTPVVGTHFIQAALFSYLSRVNVLSSLIGTFIGNPLTFPFMWYIAYSLGAFLFTLAGFDVHPEMPEGQLSFSLLQELITTQFYHLFLPWLVGGYLCAAIIWAPSYYIIKHLIQGAKLARRKAQEIRLKKKTEGLKTK